MPPPNSKIHRPPLCVHEIQLFLFSGSKKAPTPLSLSTNWRSPTTDRRTSHIYVLSALYAPRKKNPISPRQIWEDLINYPKDVQTITATIQLIKIFLNSLIATMGAHFMSTNLANCCLMTPLNSMNLSKTTQKKSRRNTPSRQNHTQWIGIHPLYTRLVQPPSN